MRIKEEYKAIPIAVFYSGEVEPLFARLIDVKNQCFHSTVVSDVDLFCGLIQNPGLIITSEITNIGVTSKDLNEARGRVLNYFEKKEDKEKLSNWRSLMNEVASLFKPIGEFTPDERQELFECLGESDDKARIRRSYESPA